MKLTPLKWSQPLEIWIDNYFKNPEEGNMDISERLENVGIDRDVLSTELLIKGHQYGISYLD